MSDLCPVCRSAAHDSAAENQPLVFNISHFKRPGNQRWVTFTVWHEHAEEAQRRLDGARAKTVVGLIPSKRQPSPSAPTFDVHQFDQLIRGLAKERQKTMKQVSLETGVSEATLSRMHTKGQTPNAAGLLALGLWAGIDTSVFTAAMSEGGEHE